MSELKLNTDFDGILASPEECRAEESRRYIVAEELRDALSVVRSIVQGEVTLVPTEDLQDVERALERVGLVVWANKVRGWLSATTPAAPETEENR